VTRALLGALALVLALVTVAAAACGGAQVERAPAEEEDDEPDPVVTVALRYEDGEAETSGAVETPMTRILLVDIDSKRGRRTTDLGNYPGPCSPVDLGDRVLLGARCFWLGSGADVRIQKEGDALVATRTDTTEGGAPSPPREVARIDLLPRTRIEVLSAPPSRALAP
jgi:hypothetical protein